MSNYLKPIITAIITFPIIALLFTLPYIIFQYRKYGSIPLLRGLVVYSFILYLISAYFLIILPLPSKEFVMNLKTPSTQLIPFTFIKDFIENTSLVITNPNSYLKALKEPFFYQVLYNIFLTMPFGIYLRYYFKCSMKKTILSTFLLSLFFELTQLSGLYGIYPRSYRLFDVDDLMINTLGGFLGYLTEPIILLFLPTRDKIDEWAYKKGENVSFLRRLLAFNIDILIFIVIIFITMLFTNKKINTNFLAIIVLCYYVIIPTITKGSTLGKKFLKIKIANEDGKDSKVSQIILRNIILYYIYIPAPYYLLIFIVSLSSAIHSIIILVGLLILLVFIITSFVIVFIKVVIKKELLWYERISKTKNISTIIIEEKIKVVQQSEFEENKIANTKE